MFGRLYLWMQNIAFYMVMVTAVIHIVPNSDYKRYIRFFTGLILVVMLASPFFKILGMEDSWQNLYSSRTYQEQVEKMEQAMQTLKETYAADYPEHTGNTEESNEIGVEEIKIGR